MELSQHISKLLYRYDCVTVPGFGAFLGQRRAAHIDGKSRLIYPPNKQISFNEQLRSNDGLLANYIAEVFDLSYEEALKSIHQEVAQWKKKLHNHQLYLSPLGTLMLNQEQKLEFNPDLTTNHLDVSFGLSPVLAVETHRKFAQAPTSKPAYSLLKYAAAAALFLGTIGYYQWTTQKVNESQMLAQQEAIQKAVFDLGDLPSLTLKVIPKEETLKYFIISGAFRVESNAQKQLKILQQKGYSPIVLPANRYGLHPVAYGGYADQQLAINALRNIQRTANKSAWLFTKE